MNYVIGVFSQEKLQGGPLFLPRPSHPDMGGVLGLFLLHPISGTLFFWVVARIAVHPVYIKISDKEISFLQLCFVVENAGIKEVFC